MVYRQPIKNKMEDENVNAMAVGRDIATDLQKAIERSQITGVDPAVPRNVRELAQDVNSSDDSEDNGGEDYSGYQPINEIEEPNTIKIRDFSVKELNYGFLITVGCHKFAISTPTEAAKLIAEYLKDPKGTENKWFSNELSIKRNR